MKNNYSYKKILNIAKYLLRGEALFSEILKRLDSVDIKEKPKKNPLLLIPFYKYGKGRPHKKKINRNTLLPQGFSPMKKILDVWRKNLLEMASFPNYEKLQLKRIYCHKINTGRRTIFYRSRSRYDLRKKFIVKVCLEWDGK